MHSYDFPPAGGGFRAQFMGAVDGDTIDVLIDLGFGHYHKTRVRLAGINTPELHSKDAAERAAAQRAKQFVHEALVARSEEEALDSDEPEFPLRLVTAKVAEKYGRYLADVYFDGGCKLQHQGIACETAHEVHLNAALVAAGHAKPYDGGKR